MGFPIPLHTACAAILIVGATACGGGGGGDGGTGMSGGSVSGNGLAPSSGPGDTSLYFPDAQGDQWSFNYVTNDPNAVAPSGVVTVAVNGTKVVQSITGTVFTRTDPTLGSGGYDQYFNVSAGGVTLLGNNDTTDTITPLITPYVQLLFPVQVGPVSTVIGTQLPFSKDAMGNPITLNLTQTISNAAIESIEVPAGAYASAMRQVTSVTATAYDMGQSSPAVSGTDTIWLVPGVGQAKDQATVTGNGTTVTASSELRGYTVNGQQHGLGAIADAVPTLASANCFGGAGNLAPLNVASDGTNYLVVAHNCDASSGTAMVKWVATLLGADGSVKGSVDLSTAVALPVSAPGVIGLHSLVAFDGTNYLVVYEGDNSVAASANLEAVLVSKSGAVVSGPTLVGAAYYDYNMPGDPEALAFDGSRYLLVYVDANAVVRPQQLSGLFLTPATAVPNGAPFQISNTNTYNHDEPVIGFDGTNYLVVWIENGSNPQGLSAMRISKTGALLDAAPLLIMNDSALVQSGAGPCCDLAPTVAFDGMNYLVAYRDQRNAAPPGSPITAAIFSNWATISAARVSSSGALLDGSSTTPGITVTTATGVSLVGLRSAFINGVHWLVWEDAATRSLSGARVSTSGAVSSVYPNGFLLVPAGPAQVTEQWPAIAANANGGLVSWLQVQSSTATAVMDLPIFSP